MIVLDAGGTVAAGAFVAAGAAVAAGAQEVMSSAAITTKTTDLNILFIFSPRIGCFLQRELIDGWLYK
jgi:hypothetical protein